MHLHTYLNFAGNCEQAFTFYEQHLDGKISTLIRHGDQPGGDSRGLTGVLHARMTLGGAEISGADVPAAEPMRSAYLALTTDTAEDAERLYALLTEGGQIFMKMEETFFASRFAMFRDQFGVSWMLLGPSKIGT